jgi:hypothetical protein
MHDYIRVLDMLFVYMNFMPNTPNEIYMKPEILFMTTLTITMENQESNFNVHT